MELALARYRLLFTHPFGTAHGLRDGTDSVFVRLREEGRTGYGEATLPPYLDETQLSVYHEIVKFWLMWNGAGLEAIRTAELSPPARSAIHTAYNSLMNSYINSRNNSSISSTRTPASGRAMVTLGHTEVADIEAKLKELPRTDVLKVKLGAANDLIVLDAVKSLDNRLLFLDANQGWTRLDQALEAYERAGADRVIGLEQPFAKDRWDLHKQLRDRIQAPVYGDESIQGPEDLERAPEVFSGVNLKLMKCGGLDIAGEMAERARELGLQVMLGSMSESSLGCAAMATLQHRADLVDLDGPWLISNDPFEGMVMEQGRLRVASGANYGVELRAPCRLELDPIGT